MKKKLFLFATAALVLAGCNNDVTIDENVALEGSNAQKEIAFTPLAHSPKRAISNTNYGIIEGPDFLTTWGMTVSAVDVASTTTFFTGTNFVYSGTTGIWKGETSRYWPLAPVQVNFLAIAHANGDNTTGVDWGTTNKTEHQVVVNMADNYAIASAQRDFMYAIGNGQVTKEGNNLSFPAKIDMQFKHTQAYLIFCVKADNTESQAIKIKDIQIKGARTAGKATIARNDPDAYADDNVNLLWEDPESPVTSAYPNGGDGSAYVSVTPTQAAYSPTVALTNDFVERGHLLVVPNMDDVNSFDDGGFTSFKILYEWGGNNYEYEYIPAASATVLEAGKKYTFNITFKLHEIFVSPTVSAWTDNLPANSVNILPSVAYTEAVAGTNVSIGATEGTYMFTISGVPANGGEDYNFVEADAASNNLDFIDGAVTIVENTTDTSVPGTITLQFKSTGGADGSKHLLKLKLGSTEKMTINLTLDDMLP